jgi:chaperonin GroEL
LRTIVENAGLEGSVVVAVAEGSGDLDTMPKQTSMLTCLQQVSLIPKVTRVALENAASVAGMILTTECALIDIKEDNGGTPNGWWYARNDVFHFLSLKKPSQYY